MIGGGGSALILDPNDPLALHKHIAKEMTAGALSCMVASAVTNPLDVVKIRLQMLPALPKPVFCMTQPMTLYLASAQRLGLWHGSVKGILTESGWKGLVWPGFSAAMLREVFYSSIRFGLYSSIKDGICSLKGAFAGGGGTGVAERPTTLHFGEKCAAGILTGAIGSAIANPTDLIKVRHQAEWGLYDPATGRYVTGPCKGQPPVLGRLGAFRCLLQVYQEGGLAALFRGVGATSARAGLLTGGQLAAYDSAKSYLRAAGLEEGLEMHVKASIWSGWVAATFSAPADVVKTRYMCAMKAACPDSRRFRSAFDCFLHILKTEGLVGLYRGWIPSYLRLAPHFIISLPLNEQFRKLFGLGTL